MFDSRIWKDSHSTSVFHKFIASLRLKICNDIKGTSGTHKFIRTLRDTRKLVRCYTQNIDGLEVREGLCSDLDRGKGKRTRFSKKSVSQPKTTRPPLPGSSLDGGCEVVQLHGDLELLRCTLCNQNVSWEGQEKEFLQGKVPKCKTCSAQNGDRQRRGKRGISVGSLRPNIVLYGEENPSADRIAAITQHDLSLAPDVLLILGTSLQVHGFKVLVKEFAKAVHSRARGKGKVVFVNLTKPSGSVWNGIIDYWVGMDCDEWVDDLHVRRPDLFESQEELKLRVKKNNMKGPESSKDDVPKANGAVEEKENFAKPFAAPMNRSIRQDREGRPLSDLGAKDLNISTKESQLFEKSEVMAVNTSFSQLPTPPPSGHGRKRTLSDPEQLNSKDFFRGGMMSQTPSKRRKTEVSIWEDEEHDAMERRDLRTRGQSSHHHGGTPLAKRLFFKEVRVPPFKAASKSSSPT